MTNPVEYWNDNHSWSECFEGIKNIEWLNDRSIRNQKLKKESFAIVDQKLVVTGNNDLKLKEGESFSKFQLITAIKFNGKYLAAMTWVDFNFMKKDIPFMRVGTDYFKIIKKTDRYGVERVVIKGWKKDEIKQDHGAHIFNDICRFDDFCIEPNNQDYSQIINSCYNLYAHFSHVPHNTPVQPRNIPVSFELMKHIFGDQVHLGEKYIKALFQHPKSPMPILCLVSEERQTGKTTFLNWMQMIFGDNFIQINPEDLTSQFNSSYATKNIIALDETVIDKSHAVEKLKSIATAKTISVNQKFVANYALPFFGKIIICTNKEKDFMRIDEEEIRFWVRKVPVIEAINTNIENDLMDEIPMFLRYLSDLPKLDFSRSRMLFTAAELKNDNLTHLKKESWSSLRKEIHMAVEDLFIKNDNLTEIRATAADFKARFFDRVSQWPTSYIFKVLKDEMKAFQLDLVRYAPFDNDPLSKVRGRPFIFYRADFHLEVAKEPVSDQIPF